MVLFKVHTVEIGASFLAYQGYQVGIIVLPQGSLVDGAFAGPRVAMCLHRIGVDIGPAGTVGEVRNCKHYAHPGQLSFEELRRTFHTLG